MLRSFRYELLFQYSCPLSMLDYMRRFCVAIDGSAGDHLPVRHVDWARVMSKEYPPYIKKR